MALEARCQLKCDMFFYATMCHVCKRFGDGVRLQRCGNCGMIAYCGKQHQKKHWKLHRPLCEAIKKVQESYKMERGEVPKESIRKKELISHVSKQLGRELEAYETQMFMYPVECTICHEQNRQSLKECQKCAVSFCKSHKCSIMHTNICASLELSLRPNTLFVRNEINIPNLSSYLGQVSYTSAYNNIIEFINFFGNVTQTDSEMYNIFKIQHSYHLTRPLTLFYAIKILKYEPKSKDLVIHVVGASKAEELTLTAWEVLPRLIGTVMSVAIIMIGPELKCQFNPLHTCDNCTSREKKCLAFKFHDVLYENYVRSSLFIKPDLIVGFNLGIYASEQTWAPSIMEVKKQKVPFILTCCMRIECPIEKNEINRIVNEKVNHAYEGKNPFASLYPFRQYGPDYVYYDNQFIIVYRSL